MDKKAFFTSLKKNVMLIVLIHVYILFFILTKGSIFSPNNFYELINQNAYVYILGTGMLMCMLTGGNIDLSCGAFVCLLGAIGGVLMTVWKVAPGISVFAMLLIGLGYGAVLGWLIAYVRIPPWIATLVGYLAFRGLGTQILSTASSTNALANFPKPFLDMFYGHLFETAGGEFNWPCFIIGLSMAYGLAFLIFGKRSGRLAKGYKADTFTAAALKSWIGFVLIMIVTVQLAQAGGFPTVLLWVGAIITIYSFITGRTTIGRHFYVVGGNKEAARLSGVNTRRIMFAAYMNMAFLTSIATMVVVSRTQSAYADAGKGFEMDAISACVVGGVSASGGAGTVLGMVIGATLIGVINLGMSLIALDMNYQRVIKGLVLLGAVVFDILIQKKNK